MYLAYCVGGIVMSNSILCCASSSGIFFIYLYVHAKTSLNFLQSIHLVVPLFVVEMTCVSQAFFLFSKLIHPTLDSDKGFL